MRIAKPQAAVSLGMPSLLNSRVDIACRNVHVGTPRSGSLNRWRMDKYRTLLTSLFASRISLLGVHLVAFMKRWASTLLKYTYRFLDDESGIM